MPITIPLINMEVEEVIKLIQDKLQEPKYQRRAILVIVSIILLLDNMLYMVIVPIIPDYLRSIGTWETHRKYEDVDDTSPGLNKTATWKTVYEGEDSAIGMLFASKAIVQLMINPFSGALIDRIGYETPIMIGLTIMFFSTTVFACGKSYNVLFAARSLQGVGSAFADTAGLAMIADRFTEENERSKALGIALAFISFGSLVAPPFGGLLYEFCGKVVPFTILALVCLADGGLVMFVVRPGKESIKMSQFEKPVGTPLWRLLIDPYIAVCAGALVMANVSLAFLEPTITKWMMETMPDIEEWQIGLIWLPAFFPHVLGVYLTVKWSKDYPQYQWLMAAVGLAMEGLSCLIVPFATSYWFLMFPLCTICFGIALIDTALLPTLGYLVDVRYVSVYGSIYAIADISYSLAYALGPIIAGGVVETIGFTALNILIAISNLGYVPVLSLLRHVYDYKPFEDENVLMSDPPTAQYQTYMMHDSNSANQREVPNQISNHLEYGAGQQAQQQETGFSEKPYQQQTEGQSMSGYEHRQVSSRRGFKSGDKDRMMSSEDEAD